MTGRTTVDIDKVVPSLARQGIDATQREIVVEETHTTTRRIIIRPPQEATTFTHSKDEKEHEWDNLEP